MLSRGIIHQLQSSFPLLREEGQKDIDDQSRQESGPCTEDRSDIDKLEGNDDLEVPVVHVASAHGYNW